MAVFVKKSILLFLLSILLLIYASHANDATAPHLREGERKLISVNFLKYFGTIIGRSKAWKLHDITARSIGGTDAGRAFAKKGFSFGYRQGKLFYKVEDRCNNYPNSFMGCKPSDSCIQCKNKPTLPNCIAVSCVVRVVARGKIDSCAQFCGVRPQIPCAYKNGIVTQGNKVLTTQEVYSKCLIQ